MCIVCVLFDKGKITKKEAKAALFETINEAKTKEEINHIRDLYTELEKSEVDKKPLSD